MILRVEAANEWVRRGPMYFMILIISLFQGLLQGLPDPFTIVLLLIKGGKKCDGNKRRLYCNKIVPGEKASLDNLTGIQIFR